ncbi:MAG TPA: endo-1,4-beta-xylanase [Tepidisphaeraceae bacterium]|jgi:GH35 family endo-1,4-beta-xylanase
MRALLWIGLGILVTAGLSHAQALPPTGAVALPLKSSGAAADTGWRLDQNGFVGAYLKTDKASDVEIRIRATGTASPKMSATVADTTRSHVVDGSTSEYSSKFSLPAGTFFLRIDMSNASAATPRSLTIRDVSVSGATLLPDNTDANALASADTYIENYRKGPAAVTIPGAAEGTPVHIKLRCHAFNFGGTVHGYRDTNVLTKDPAPDTDAFHFQKFAQDHFNLLVCSNGGKWMYNETDRDKLTMEFVDQFLDYAQSHGFRARMHALLWDSRQQQPTWVNQLLDRAMKGDAEAKADLRKQISERIDYLVRQRCSKYIELDVLNEPHHQPSFWKAFGAEGMADIFNETARAVEDAGQHTTLYLNEYNVLQWSRRPPYVRGGKENELEPYANWYRELYESIRDAGGKVSGVGIQYYAIKGGDADKKSPHSAAHFVEVFQNLSILGLPISLTEFGVQGRTTTPETAADIIEDTMRMIFGTPQATTFVIWGHWAGAMWDQAPAGALVDKQWKLTAAGERYEKLMKQWDTDITANVGKDGKVHFNGFFGDYEVTVGEKTYPLTLVKGTSSYAVRP